MPLTVNDTIALTVLGTVGTQDHVHTLHFRVVAGTPTEADLVTDWQTACRASYRGQFRTDDTPITLYRAAKVCGNVPLPAPFELAETVGSQTGSRAVGPVRAPSFLAALVKEKGTLAGRSRSGRWFISGADAGDPVTNQWGAPYLALIQAYATAMTTRFITTGSASLFRLVTHSKKLAKQTPALNCQDSSTLVASLIVSPYVTTMRSRKLGHGN